ncbi:MAG TPA: glycoside hydrolase, partial [Bacteroidota bacterium]
MIGPHRAGRTVGAAGVPSQPNVFYIGVNNGGVWKTNDYGRTWNPIFDDQPTGSIGTVTVAPSDPNVVYVGSGEGLHRPDLSTGDGIYKSTDAGKSWQHFGLRDGQQIGSIIVDPHDPNRIFVAVLGHPYGPNEERGVYRSTDGGRTFEKVLYKDENTGAIALSFDPSNAQTVYAVLWEAREGPWENGSWQGPNSGLFKSVDGGTTWKQLAGGLPTFQQGLGRIGFCVAPSNPNRIYALVDASRDIGGLYRSEDAGENWKRINGDPRIWGRGDDFAEVKVDPKNQDIVYSANVVCWKSTDAGQSFTGFKGAPGGDDYHTIWINPDNPQIILLAVDQGATLTVNGGETWSSWYNQPTAQFYHVSTDNEFPYWVYGGQQESGSVGIASRSNDGEITFREWHTVGAEEYGYVAADPLHPNLIYGGKISRYDKNTGQVLDVSPEAIRSGKYRFIRTQPVLFSPVDPHILYLAGNVLFKTTNGGNSWSVISPDLSREKPEVPASIGVFTKPEMASQPRRGVIYAVAPSPRDVNLIWAGTDDGLIHVTRDGGKVWSNVTPPDLTSWSKVSQIDASHFDTQTAYAAVNRFRLDDLRPHIYRTHD